MRIFQVLLLSRMYHKKRAEDLVIPRDSRKRRDLSRKINSYLTDEDDEDFYYRNGRNYFRQFYFLWLFHKHLDSFSVSKLRFIWNIFVEIIHLLSDDDYLADVAENEEGLELIENAVDNSAPRLFLCTSFKSFFHQI